ncbi:S8 family serine peptidase [Pseudomarimonas arenosa]|uniref:S8 family serine peptidase n=1 Tax=Pseudomarimonas arenosa TaxID=2774145 RepID=A0AAW3ZH28_9GAMM|nr:S8 family serine peptidase [Pseudomarimonas arenosa]MBD8525331.1 S8 family serine peptidase [Pseudomarimonas arenosa]
MRPQLLVLATLAALFPADVFAADHAPNGSAAKLGDARSTYIVQFKAAPLASFRGPGTDPDLQDLKATSPAVTGARKLNLTSKSAIEYREFLRQQRSASLAEASSRLGRPLAIEFEYDVALHAVALDLSATEARLLEQVPGIALVEREQLHRPLTDAGPAFIGADAIWEGGAGVATRGEGVVVGVIDSGINQSHPSFAATGPVSGFTHSNPLGGFLGVCAAEPGRCNGKLIGVHDFTTCIASDTGCDDREPNNGTDVDGHGSHVASTAVGNTLQASFPLPGGATTRTVSGVAPHANLIAYKACEEEETCRGRWTLAAINQAVADGVDVINYSLGTSTPVDPWTSSTAQAMLNAREAGVVVVVAAGNDGPAESTMGSPADAPWNLAVANVTHDRVTVNRLLDLSGGATPPPGDGVLLGEGQTLGYGPVSLVTPSDFPLCSQGSSSDFPPSGESNPWSAGRFSGEIVVCLRGVQARVAKSNNVRLAGGGGMVLVNQAADGEATIADEHSIPSTHVGAADGAALLSWLSQGSGHRGRLEGAQIRVEPSRSDLLVGSSSRGPVVHGPYLKPDLAAPGSSIQAAAGTGSGLVPLSGTSMASPHVAGAAALLMAQHPDWDVSDVVSALRSTASPTVKLGAEMLADPLQQGSGRVQLEQATRAGLGFPASAAEFLASRPASGGSPAQLNLPSLVSDRCFESCSFTRRVKDLRGGGRWRAEFVGEAGMEVQVQPAEFELAAGAQQTLQFSVNVNDIRLFGRYVEGRIKLIAVDANGAPNETVPATELPLAIYSSPGQVPSELQISVPDRGFVDLSFSGLLELADLEVTATDPAAPTLRRFSLSQDPTNTLPFDSFSAGAAFVNFAIPETATLRDFVVNASLASAARDVDLFVGVDSNGNNQPDESELLCESTSAQSQEACEITVLSASNGKLVWVMAQNFQSSAPGAVDTVDLEVFVRDTLPVNGPRLIATAASDFERNTPFDVRLIVDDLTLAQGERRLAFLNLGVTGREPFARIPLTVSRAAGANAAKLLHGSSVERIRLASGAASESLAIDLPSNIQRLRITASPPDLSHVLGSQRLYLSRGGSAAQPGLGVAPPREQALATSVGFVDRIEIDIGAEQGLSAGRWFITPVSLDAETREFDLTISLDSSGSLPNPKFGAYFNPARSGAGAFLFGAGDQWGLLWYTYHQDGTPVWYTASAAAAAATAEQSQWVAPLYRARWNGSSAPLTMVGEIIMTKISDTAFQFGWNLDGESGSERYEFIDGGGCARQANQPFDINGFWFNPSSPGYGYSVNAFPNLETNGAYFFDANGGPIWALGSVSPFGTPSMALDLRIGPCPSCAYSPPVVIPGIGTLSRSYTDIRNGQMQIDVTLPAPLRGSWSLNTPVQKLTGDTGCP